MTLKRLLPLAACLLAAAVPSSALAQAGPGDNLDNAIVLNGGSPLRLSPSVIGITNVNTANYTTQQGEFNKCGNSIYGKTLWGAFRVNRTGRIDVTAAGYDSVIAINQLSSNGQLAGGPCVDRLNGRIESFPRDNLPTVKKGGTYALQVGGFQRPDGGIEGGPLEVAVELLRPERVQGDAILTWRSVRGGVRVTSIKVDGPNGSAAGVFCARKRCGRQQILRNPKLKGVFARPIAKAAAPGATSAARKTVPEARDRSQVRLSTKTAFRGRKIKNGARLVVIVLAEDQIGQAFFWNVKKNAAGAKNIGCVEPGGSRIQRQGSCDGV
jgi:hypothetical protein